MGLYQFPHSLKALKGRKEENTIVRTSFVLTGNNRYYYGFKFKDNDGGNLAISV